MASHRNRRNRRTHGGLVFIAAVPAAPCGCAACEPHTCANPYEGLVAGDGQCGLCGYGNCADRGGSATEAAIERRPGGWVPLARYPGGEWWQATGPRRPAHGHPREGWVPGTLDLAAAARWALGEAGLASNFKG